MDGDRDAARSAVAFNPSSWFDEIDKAFNHDQSIGKHRPFFRAWRRPDHKAAMSRFCLI
jgi:hypothetical protein